MRTVRSKTLANAMDQKTRSNRALGKQNREQLSEESRFQKSREIAENLMATAVWKQAKQVLLYASYGSEVSTGLLMDAALAAGKEVFLPKVLGDQMEFFRITDRAELAPGYQHILEPPGQTKRFLPDASIPTLLTAPGLAFDRSGARIGYGKGFYDRYLGKIPAADRPYLVGLCFSCQLFEILDGQKPHDINMDLIVGLPEETIEDVRETMRQLEELDPDNITVHSLAIKRAARLRMQKEQYENLHIENTAQTIDLTAECCHEMGLEPYYLYRQKNMAGNFENVGYAKPGKAGIYNILIMEEVQTIMALGAGTISKRVYGDGRIERCDNVKDVGQYIERIDEMIQRKQQLFSEE